MSAVESPVDTVAVDAAEASSLVEGYLQPSPGSALAARALVEAELLDEPRFGLTLLDGFEHPGQHPQVETLRPGRSHVDATRRFGPLAVATAVEHCAALAVAGGLAITTVTELTRVGQLGTYAAWGAEQGLVSVVAIDAPPAVAPYGGTEAALGTNPLAFAIPGSPAIVADFATSAMTEAAASAAGRTGVLQPRGGLVGTLVGLFVEALTGAIEGRSPDRTGRTATVIMVEPRDQPATAVFVENLERAFLDAGAQLPGWRRREQLDRPQSIEMPTAIHRMLVEGGKAGGPETESPGESV